WCSSSDWPSGSGGSSARRSATTGRCARSTRRRWTFPGSRRRPAQRRHPLPSGSQRMTSSAALAALEHARALVVRDDLVEQALLGLAVVQVVRPDLLAEDLLGERALLPELDGFAE